MNYKQWSESMASQVSSMAQGAQFPSEGALAGMYQEWINNLLAAEYQDLMNELTSLAALEPDNVKRNYYFKVAKIVHSRAPKVAASAGEQVSSVDSETCFFDN